MEISKLSIDFKKIKIKIKIKRIRRQKEKKKKMFKQEDKCMCLIWCIMYIKGIVQLQQLKSL